MLVIRQSAEGFDRRRKAGPVADIPEGAGRQAPTPGP